MAIMTVCGEIPAAEAGVVLSHEHIFIDLTNQLSVLSDPEAIALSREPVTRDRRAMLERNPYALRDNVLLRDTALAIRETGFFKKAGGRTIVDCTPIGIKRDARKLKTVSQETGLHIVAGCGYYTHDTHPPCIAEWSHERIAQAMVEDLREGIDGSSIRAGIIGEIGTSDPIHPDEKKVLLAAALAYHQTNAGIQVHTYPWATRGLEAADLLREQGVDPARIVICHTDVSLDMAYVRGLLERRVFVQFDNCGKQFDTTSEDGSFAAGPFARDEERVAALKVLIDEGFAAQLLLTTDICLKCLLHEYGGQGYDHVPVNMVPWLRTAGVPQEAIDMMLHENPVRVLDK